MGSHVRSRHRDTRPVVLEDHLPATLSYEPSQLYEQNHLAYRWYTGGCGSSHAFETLTKGNRVDVAASRTYENIVTRNPVEQRSRNDEQRVAWSNKKPPRGALRFSASKKNHIVTRATIHGWRRVASRFFPWFFYSANRDHSAKSPDKLSRIAGKSEKSRNGYTGCLSTEVTEVPSWN